MTSYYLLRKAYMTLAISILLVTLAVFIKTREIYFSWFIISSLLLLFVYILNVIGKHLSLRQKKELEEIEKKIEERIKFKREVKTGLLVKKSIAYRIVVTLSQVALMYIFTGDVNLSVGFSILWNIFNTFEYFAFDYVFSRLFKIGKD